MLVNLDFNIIEYLKYLHKSTLIIILYVIKRKRRYYLVVLNYLIYVFK